MKGVEPETQGKSGVSLLGRRRQRLEGEGTDSQSRISNYKRKKGRPSRDGK